MINNYFNTSYNLLNLIDDIYSYLNILELPGEYLSKSNYSFTLPVIERTPNSFIYNFSYIPTPNFMSIGNSKIDVLSMKMLPTYKDQIVLYIDKFLKDVNVYSFNINNNLNTISYYQTTKKNVVLKTINGEEINTVSRYGLNTIRLSKNITGEINLEFDKSIDVFILYFVLINSSYNSNFEFEINFSKMNYVLFDFENGELLLNDQVIFLNDFIELDGLNKFKFTTGGFGYIGKVIVLR